MLRIDNFKIHAGENGRMVKLAKRSAQKRVEISESDGRRATMKSRKSVASRVMFAVAGAVGLIASGLAADKVAVDIVHRVAFRIVGHRLLVSAIELIHQRLAFRRGAF